MPRASWRGFLRLSLVSCPVYLLPATARTKPIRLHQVRRPSAIEESEEDLSEAQQDANVPEHPTASAIHDDAIDEFDQGGAATRIVLRPHDPRTGEEVEKQEVVKGYEYGRGQFVTFSAAELKALDVESSKVIDLETFAARGEIDPVYFDSAYYLHPDGALAVETLRVIGAAMAEAGVVGIGRLTLSRRERMVIVEPRGTGMALFTLRAAAEVRASQFGSAEDEFDAEMVAIAGAIIRQRIGKFDPSTFRDRYQEALQKLIEAKLKGIAVKPQPTPTPPPVIDLMAALKRSLGREKPMPKRGSSAAGKGRQLPSDRRRQAALLLPLAGGRKRKEQPATVVPSRRRKA
jgi:DNA end-binding protein Ku